MTAEDQKKEWLQWQERQRKKVHHELEKKDFLEERKHSLRRIKHMLVSRTNDWTRALASDLGKSPVEAYASEIAVLLNEIDNILYHLDKWTKADMSTRFSVGMQEKTKVTRLPFGTVLVLSPWNYPLQLALMPVIGALAAGNSCVLKPSEYAPETSRLLRELIGRYFPIERLAVIEGAEDVSQTLTQMKWDFIFFTGSTQVGKKVYEAAAETLTPVLLELGGKNVCIVDHTANSTETVRNIIWGKYINAGQTCIAPDVVYVHDSVYDSFLEKAHETITDFYGKNPAVSREYGRIITEKHVDRLSSYFSEATVFFGGRSNKKKRYVSPTILIDPQPDSALLKEEIFGPLLVVRPYQDFESLIKILEGQKNSLVSYLFSQNEAHIRLFTQSMKSGTLSINQVVRFAGNGQIPFGGVGTSGFGRYHGEESIRAFSYIQSRVHYRILAPVRSLYPPYPPFMLSGLKWLRKHIL